jgi:hypothetical protein
MRRTLLYAHTCPGVDFLPGGSIISASASNDAGRLSKSSAIYSSPTSFVSVVTPALSKSASEYAHNRAGFGVVQVCQRIYGMSERIKYPRMAPLRKRAHCVLYEKAAARRNRNIYLRTYV